MNFGQHFITITYEDLAYLSEYDFGRLWDALKPVCRARAASVARRSEVRPMKKSAAEAGAAGEDGDDATEPAKSPSAAT